MADQILAGQMNFESGLIQDRTPKAKAASPKSKRDLRDEDAGLVGQLKALRFEIADEKNVPAYVVFTDKALIEMATYKPQTKEAFLQINGVGPKKVETYFEAFSEVIHRYLAAQSEADSK